MVRAFRFARWCGCRPTTCRWLTAGCGARDGGGGGGGGGGAYVCTAVGGGGGGGGGGSGRRAVVVGRGSGLGRVVVPATAACDPLAKAYVLAKPSSARLRMSASRRRPGTCCARPPRSDLQLGLRSTPLPTLLCDLSLMTKPGLKAFSAQDARITTLELHQQGWTRSPCFPGPATSFALCLLRLFLSL
jgi:hypothetical protein